jgi:hypothetical protein
MPKLRIPRYPMPLLLRRAALAYLIVWQLSPPMAYGTGWRALAVLAMLLWLALDTLAPRSVLRRPNWPVFACIVFTLYSALIEWLVPDAGALNRHFAVWITFFFLLVGESQQRGHGDEARFCFWTILLVMPIWQFATLVGIETVAADVARTVVRSSREARELADQGIGGYGLVYGTIVCLPFLAQLALRVRHLPGGARFRWMQRALIWGNFLLSALLVLRAGYSIAVILAVLSVLCVLLIRSRRPLVLAMSVCLVGLLVLLTNIVADSALRSLEGAVAGTEYSAKLRDIQTTLAKGQSTGTVEGRTERYVRSLRLFVENPIAGTLTFDDVGKHSAILDRFAQYGFVFGLLFLAILSFMPLRYFGTPQLPIGLAVAFLFVAVGFPLLNNLFMSWGLILYVFSRGAFVVMGVPLEKGRTPQSPRQDQFAHAATGSPG